MKKWVVGSLMVASLLVAVTIATVHSTQVAEIFPPLSVGFLK